MSKSCGSQNFTFVSASPTVGSGDPCHQCGTPDVTMRYETTCRCNKCGKSKTLSTGPFCSVTCARANFRSATCYNTVQVPCTATGCVNGKVTTTRTCTATGCVNGKITTTRTCTGAGCVNGKVTTTRTCTATGCVNGKVTTTKACTRSGCVNGYITTSYNC